MPVRLRYWREDRCGEVGRGAAGGPNPYGGQRVGRTGVAGHAYSQQLADKEAAYQTERINLANANSAQILAENDNNQR